MYDRTPGATASKSASTCLRAMVVVRNGRLIIRQAARIGL
jgi:hypothetical protein